MTQKDPKYVVAAKPVNRRTAARDAAAPPAAVSPLAQKRARLSQARNRLGPPLAELLRSPARSRREAIGTRAVLGAMAVAAGGIGLFLAWLQASAFIAAGAAVSVLGGSWLARSRRRDAVALPLSEEGAAPLLDPECVAALDRAMEPLAAELPPPLVAPLADLKQRFVRLARHPAAGAIDEHFTLEDRMYVNECLRRYLPDSLQSYLAVPPEQRTQPLSEGQSAQALLLSQLSMLSQELAVREERLARSAGEALLRQERFLRSKSS